MTIETAMAANPNMGARQLWESDKELQKIEYSDFVKQWHDARMKVLKPTKHNTTGHDNIDAAKKPTLKKIEKPTA